MMFDPLRAQHVFRATMNDRLTAPLDLSIGYEAPSTRSEASRYLIRNSLQTLRGTFQIPAKPQQMARLSEMLEGE